MVLDYSERKPVSKNRTRKQPVGIFVIILISAVSMSFALGLLSGWFLFKPGRKAAQNQAALGSDGTRSASAPSSPAAQFQNPEASASKAAAPPLTFYETLPKGGKAVIGSGLNPKKNEAAQAPKPGAVAPAAPQHTGVPQPAATPATVKPEELKEQAPAAAEHPKPPAAEAGPPRKQADAVGKFCVQVASSQDRKEAETLKAKLAEKGLPVYILESKIKDKGTWYRIRIGKHLTQQAAGELAQKAGKGALVITE